ncbi:DUF4309 domain-containing protein [Brevibacillus antibioticus]|uniref:DUF4309 domain-containing protein n=1 Tax=Brevibacillus antibioticus TaxID=2570228 RepID=A0A4U2YFT5_9BACL|nr:DUF4309 domain-containing protein [Brevibacillus antibioticus]TKI58391.1 DUF4309 domain-containing protein [Brevibacillus antibioticus]
MVDLIKICRNALLVVVLSSITLFGCSNVSEKTEDIPVTSAQSDTLEKVKNGQLEGVLIGIGATKKEVLDKVGTPIEGRNSEYGFTVYYDGFNLQFEDYANSIDEVKDTSKVVLMNAEPKTVGMTGKPEEIKKIVGEPSREFMDDTGDDTFILEYENNGNLLRFTFDSKDSSVRYVTLRVK